jgi:hypothetical protein
MTDLFKTGKTVPSQSITQAQIAVVLPRGFTQAMILGTCKLGQCVLGVRPFVLGYSRLGDATLYSNSNS